MRGQDAREEVAGRLTLDSIQLHLAELDMQEENDGVGIRSTNGNVNIEFKID